MSSPATDEQKGRHDQQAGRPRATRLRRPLPGRGHARARGRIWPRGLARATARIDEWAKVVAPSTELRRRYGHDPSKFEEFRRRYRAELPSLGDK
jgi:hypothetical protein